MEHLFFAWGRVSRRIIEARRVMLLLDYDGTLTPIVERPEDAVLTEEARALIEAASHLRRFTIGIISGRAMNDLKERVRVMGIIYAGNHGLEIEGPGVRFIEPLAQEVRPLLRMIHRVLSHALSPIKGVRVEDKGLSLSVHYRQVQDSAIGEVGSIFRRTLAIAHSLGKVRTTEGKKVYEVRPPVEWDKGKAIELLVDRAGDRHSKGGLIPMFLGDDVTDEDGFRAVDKLGGISVYVGDEPDNSRAAYYLKSPDEVASFLKMAIALGGQGAS